MEKQNKLRAEAAKKKKEEAKRKREQEAATGTAAGEQHKSNSSAYASGIKKVDKVTKAIAATKRMGFNFDEPQAPDVSEHFVDEKFEMTVEQVKTLAEESHMRKVNAQQASKAFKVFINKSDTDELSK